MEKSHIQRTANNLINNAGLAFIAKFFDNASMFTGIIRFSGIKRGPGIMFDYDFDNEKNSGII